MQRIPAKILVVEDDRQLRKALITTLKDNGYDVVSAQDGEEGFKLATAELPSLIILDLHMPKLNGHEMLKLLRLNPEARHIPVIVLTNDESPESIKEAKEKGVTAYFPKASTSLSEILEVIGYLLTK